MLFDSHRRENIHFGTMDEAEEFVFFVENLLHENKQRQAWWCMKKWVYSYFGWSCYWKWKIILIGVYK